MQCTGISVGITLLTRAEGYESSLTATGCSFCCFKSSGISLSTMKRAFIMVSVLIAHVKNIRGEDHKPNVVE